MRGKTRFHCKISLLSRASTARVYSLSYYNRRSGELILATDKIGARPLYYYIDKSLIYFSNALRVLEAVEKVPKRVDVSAVAQSVVVKYPFGDRTPYADIKLLRGSTFVKANDSRPSLNAYHRWEDTQPTRLEESEFLQTAYDRFVSAVACRAARDESATAFLSGGLDSRCVVAVLHSLGKRLATLNFSLPDSQDLVYAKQFAHLIGTNHVTKARPATIRQNDISMSQSIVESFSNGDWGPDCKPRFPQLVFSGVGGNQSIGHYYMDEALVAKARKYGIETTTEHFLGEAALPNRIFAREVRSKLEMAVHRGIIDELARYPDVDPGLAYFIFVLTNDNPHHLLAHHEDLDLNRIEFVLPFCDGRLLELLVSAPVDRFLHYKFYHKWLCLFPPTTTAVPWQTYPQNLPCPVQGTGNVRTQFERTRGERFRAAKQIARNCWRAVLGADFPSTIISRRQVILRLLLHNLRISNYSYVFRTCDKFCRYYTKARGEVVMPQVGPQRKLGKELWSPEPSVSR